MIVVAGPSGSGKTALFPTSSFGVDSFNIDDRCAQILGSYRAISPSIRSAVAAECERFILAHIESGTSFAVETTLRSAIPIEQARHAIASGFTTYLRFIATESVQENIDRVTQRAQAGGHAASEDEIRRIHASSLGNLRRAVEVSETARIYDSTTRWQAPRLVALKRKGKLTIEQEPPAWLKDYLGT